MQMCFYIANYRSCDKMSVMRNNFYDKRKLFIAILDRL